MADQATVVVHFKDLANDDALRENLEKHCRALAEEFSEVTKLEITLSQDGAGFIAHGHVTGKNTDAATHAKASELGPAAERMLDKVERQLRRVHDKRIFSQRREAQRTPQKRRSPR